jgi:hypothetical protein
LNPQHPDDSSETLADFPVLIVLPEGGPSFRIADGPEVV